VERPGRESGSAHGEKPAREEPELVEPMTMARAADCHAHVFCGAAYPYAPDTVYEPHPGQAGTVEQFLAVLDAHGLSHGLLVGAGPYGPDNRCLLRGIAGAGGRLKGIALVRADVADRELDALGAGGVVGIRINLSTHGLTQLTAPGADRLLARLRERGWLVQVHCERDELVAAAPILRRAGVRIMVDHLGRPDPRRGLDQPGFRTLLALGRAGEHVVKLSGPFRSSIEGPPYRDVDPFAAAAIEAFGLERCVWGSDWPFVRMDARMDYGPVYACLSRWLPDPLDRRQVLWEAPARLFGFS
jgi:predicted TIM-barrel fold metal-dependent hydrolase